MGPRKQAWFACVGESRTPGRAWGTLAKGVRKWARPRDLMLVAEEGKSDRLRVFCSIYMPVNITKIILFYQFLLVGLFVSFVFVLGSVFGKC